MKNKTTFFAYSIALLLLSSILLWACNKQEAIPTTVTNQFVPNFTLAKTGSEVLTLYKDPKANIIRSLADYDALVDHSPLAKLPKSVRDDFRNNIVVLEGYVGIAGMKYGDIQEALSADEFAQVMAMFGMDSKQGYFGLSEEPSIIYKMRGGNTLARTSEFGGTECKDYQGYACEKANSCVIMNSKYICMSRCNTSCP